jgi:hypothetical protein
MLLRKGARLSRLALLGVVLHALFLVIADFEHHDIICHLKTPQHCTSCALSPLGSELRHAANPGSCRMADVGRAEACQLIAGGVLLTVSSTGRSPPVPA